MRDVRWDLDPVVWRVGLIPDLYVQVYLTAPVGNTAPERLTATFEACLPERAFGGTGSTTAASQLKRR